MEPFNALKSQTLCPFAQSARIDYGPLWSHHHTFAENTARVAAALHIHLAAARRERLQGFVAQVGGDELTCFQAAVVTFRRFVFELGNNDSSCRTALEKEIGAEDWNFVFAEEPIFLNLFASCYPVPHSKKIDDPEHIYVFFQPEFTFEFCNVNRARTALKDQIRNTFAGAGMPYDGQTIDTRRKALSYVFPLRPGYPPVEWWRIPTETAPSAFKA